MIKEVEKDGNGLNELLRGNPDLESDCLTRALIAAVKKGNHFNIGKLVIKGATNIDEALELSKQMRQHAARAMLLLVKAAMSNDRNLVLKLFGETGGGPPSTGLDCSDEGFAEVQKVVMTGKVSTVVPIEIAHRSNHPSMREELLLRTDVNQKEGTVYWHGLRLLSLDLGWLRKIQWVKRLRLARNGFKSLPNEMGVYLRQVSILIVDAFCTHTHTHYTHTHTHTLHTLHSATSSFCQVVKLDLQFNELVSIPRNILELPSLSELNLSNNKLLELPELQEWSSTLTVLDLSHNKLTDIPGNPIAQSIRSLNLAENDIRNVPQCVCNFVTLQTLDLSENKDILSLPAQMGRLKELSQLNLKGLKDLNDPPRNMQRTTKDCIIYLKSKLLSARGFYQMKLMLVGKQNRGKTTLVARLQGRDYGNESTVGVDVSEWEYKPTIGKRPFFFSIWDFGGQEEYYATHQCFLSERSLYLLLFNVKHGDAGVEELKPWLNNIALRAPDSCVLIVGTHLDEVAERERDSVDRLLQKVADIASAYGSKLQIKEVLAVGLKNRLENVGLLKDAIYNSAQDYVVKGQHVMGQMIPASYFQLDKVVTGFQKEVRNNTRDPIMHKEDFRNHVLQLNLDIQDEDELKTATLFLNNVGTLLHYDDRSHNLDELYFIDPRWLCDLMAKIVTIRERNPYITDGILNTKNLSFILRDERFPLKYFEQYLTLLDRFEIALALDSRRILIPSMLSESRPAGVDVNDVNGSPLFARHIVFNSSTPPGFWSRLISRVMHSIPQVRVALESHTPLSDEQEIGHEPLPVSLHTQDTEPVSLQGASTGDLPSNQELSAPPPLAISGPILGAVPNEAVVEIPNFLRAVPQNIQYQVDPSQVRLQYWRNGIFYQDPELVFRVESLIYAEKKEGVLIVASPNNMGKKTIGVLVDHAMALIKDWYPGMTDSGQQTNKGIEQLVLCPECLCLKRVDPYRFEMQECSKLIAGGTLTIECRYNKAEQAKNHIVSLADVVPDLLLQDIDTEFLLNVSEIVYKEDDASLLGQGGFGKVYRGRCKGKPVAIKKYQTISSSTHSSDEAFNELRKEAMLLQQSHHPCLVCLVGVCVHPSMALVLEEAPMGSLERPLIKQRLAIHRVVIHRIVAQVAAALKFLHNNGVIFRDLKAANVLLWSLDPESLCHCKVTDFGIATYAAPIGARGLHGTKGFIAPEVLHLSRKKSERPVYTNQADVFSFGMLLYQMIARRHPYHDLAPVKIDSAVDSGERPKLLEIPQAETAFFYLTRLMQKCWQGDPNHRPTTSDIINDVCMSSFQSVMTVQPARSRLSLRHACVSAGDPTQVSIGNRQEPELWVCCDGDEGTEITVYTTNTMTRQPKIAIKDNQVQCISLCGDQVWVASRAGIASGMINIYNASTRECLHNITLKEYSVTCMTPSDSLVYCGTLEGFCFAFSRDIKLLKTGKPLHREIGDYTIDGILATKGGLWVSHTHFIHFLNLTTLAVEGTLKPSNAYIGQLKLSPDGTTIFSAHLSYHNTGTYLSAWSCTDKKHLYDVDIKKQMKNIDQSADQNIAITAMTPALDTVWLGMSTGHILVFQGDELLTSFWPYKDYIRFLVCIPGDGPCRTEKAMVVSGAKEFRSPFIPGLPDYEVMDERGVPVDKGGTLIIWEAFPSKMCRQISMIQSRSSTYLENHHSVKQVIQDGGFKDGTCLLKDRTDDSTTTESSEGIVEAVTVQGISTGRDNVLEVSTAVTTVNGKRMDGLDTLLNPTAMMTEATKGDPLPSVPEEPAEPVFLKTHISSTNVETMDIKLPPDGSTEVRVSCTKPAQLQVLLTQLETNTNLTAIAERFKLTYYSLDDVRCIIGTQLDLEKYLDITKRPQLSLVAKDVAF